MTWIEKCSDDRCEDGWVSVLPGYAERVAADLAPSDDLSAAEREALATFAASRRTAAANSRYPCRVCRRGQFFKWARGCYAAGHDAATCSHCREDGSAPLGYGARSRRRPAEARPPERPPDPADSEDLGGGTLYDPRTSA